MPIAITNVADDNKPVFDIYNNRFSVSSRDDTRPLPATHKTPTSVANEYTIPHFFRD